MSNENYEVTEVVADEVCELTEVCEGTMDEVEGKSGSGAGLAALVVGGVALVAGLAVAGVKKLKNKDTDKPKKPKTKLKLVRVPVETDEMAEIYEASAEDVFEDVETVEETEE